MHKKNSLNRLRTKNNEIFVQTEIRNYRLIFIFALGTQKFKKNTQFRLTLSINVLNEFSTVKIHYQSVFLFLASKFAI